MTGLLPGAMYECVSDEQFPDEIGKKYSAEGLMQIGLQLPLNYNYASVRRVFRLVEGDEYMYKKADGWLEQVHVNQGKSPR